MNRAKNGKNSKIPFTSLRGLNLCFVVYRNCVYSESDMEASLLWQPLCVLAFFSWLSVFAYGVRIRPIGRELPNIELLISQSGGCTVPMCGKALERLHSKMNRMRYGHVRTAFCTWIEFFYRHWVPLLYTSLCSCTPPDIAQQKVLCLIYNTKVWVLILSGG